MCSQHRYEMPNEHRASRVNAIMAVVYLYVLSTSHKRMRKLEKKKEYIPSFDHFKRALNLRLCSK